MKRTIIDDKCIYTTDLPSIGWNFYNEDYLPFCEANGIEPGSEDSAEYYEWLMEETRIEWEDFRNNLQDSEWNNNKCMILGSLGLWDGRHTIEGVVCDSLLEAIEKCIEKMNDWDIVLNDGHLEITTYHHDGTNCFEIHLLSKRGEEEIEGPKYTWEGDKYEPKGWWFKNINGDIF
jgi:hypothetical protein